MIDWEKRRQEIIDTWNDEKRGKILGDFCNKIISQEKEMMEELMDFIKEITLFLQDHSNYNSKKIELMFQKAYKLYVKYDVEKGWVKKTALEELWDYICDFIPEGTSKGYVTNLFHQAFKEIQENK